MPAAMRVYGVVSRLDRKDVWMLRLFRPTQEAAALAERATAQEILDLGWDKAEVGIVTFDSAKLSGFERWRGLAGKTEGEVAIIMREFEHRVLDIRTVVAPRRINKVLGT